MSTIKTSHALKFVKPSNCFTKVFLHSMPWVSEPKLPPGVHHGCGILGLHLGIISWAKKGTPQWLRKQCSILGRWGAPHLVFGTHETCFFLEGRQPLWRESEFSQGLADEIFVNSSFTAGVFAEAFPLLSGRLGNRNPGHTPETSGNSRWCEKRNRFEWTCAFLWWFVG